MSVLLKLEMVADYALDLDSYIDFYARQKRIELQRLIEDESRDTDAIVSLAKVIHKAEMDRKALQRKMERAYDDHDAYVETLAQMAESGK